MHTMCVMGNGKRQNQRQLSGTMYLAPRGLDSNHMGIVDDHVTTQSLLVQVVLAVYHYY